MSRVRVSCPVFVTTEEYRFGFRLREKVTTFAKRDTWMKFSSADTHSPILVTVLVALDELVKDCRA